MTIKQLSIFLENKPGALSTPCRLLADAGINVQTFALADTQQFGILRLIVSDWERGRELLQEAGYIVNVTEVVAVEVDDRPGGLAAALKILSDHDLNVEYMYGFVEKATDRAMLVFRFEDTDRATKVLANSGIRVVTESDIRGL